MSADRAVNYKKADAALMKQTGMTKAELQAYKSENQLTWHETNDMKTMQLVKTDINKFFGHLGGVSEIKNAPNGNFRPLDGVELTHSAHTPLESTNTEEKIQSALDLANEINDRKGF